MKNEYETWKDEIEHGPRSTLFGTVVLYLLLCLGAAGVAAFAVLR